MSSYQLFAGETHPSRNKKNNDNAGLTLPAGFTATVVAEGYGLVRHITLTKTGGLYAKLGKLYKGKGILYFKQSADGKLELVSSFGKYIGTGIAIKNGYLYASSNTEVFRYKLNDKEEVIDTANPEKNYYRFVRQT